MARVPSERGPFYAGASASECDFRYIKGLTTVRGGARIKRSGLPPSPYPPKGSPAFFLCERMLPSLNPAAPAEGRAS